MELLLDCGIRNADAMPAYLRGRHRVRDRVGLCLDSGPLGCSWSAESGFVQYLGRISLPHSRKFSI